LKTLNIFIAASLCIGLAAYFLFIKNQKKNSWKVECVTIVNSPLAELEKEAGLTKILRESKSDFEKLKALTLFANRSFSHAGDTDLKAHDPLSILRAAKLGTNMRCVEYSILLAGLLQAVGYPARVLSLKRKDVETASYGAGHVCVEAFLFQFDKWVFVDPQCAAIFEKKGIPQSGVEIRDNLEKNEQMKIVFWDNLGNTFEYESWIRSYFFYLDTSGTSDLFGKHMGRVMLCPLGAEKILIFQKKTRLNIKKHIFNTREFYPLIQEKKPIKNKYYKIDFSIK
jgi:hypothetical protein